MVSSTMNYYVYQEKARLMTSLKIRFLVRYLLLNRLGLVWSFERDILRETLLEDYLVTMTVLSYSNNVLKKEFKRIGDCSDCLFALYSISPERFILHITNSADKSLHQEQMMRELVGMCVSKGVDFAKFMFDNPVQVYLFVEAIYERLNLLLFDKFIAKAHVKIYLESSLISVRYELLLGVINADFALHPDIYALLIESLCHSRFKLICEFCGRTDSFDSNLFMTNLMIFLNGYLDRISRIPFAVHSIIEKLKDSQKQRLLLKGVEMGNSSVVRELKHLYKISVPFKQVLLTLLPQLPAKLQRAKRIYENLKYHCPDRWIVFAKAVSERYLPVENRAILKAFEYLDPDLRSESEVVFVNICFYEDHFKLIFSKLPLLERICVIPLVSKNFSEFSIWYILSEDIKLQALVHRQIHDNKQLILDFISSALFRDEFIALFFPFASLEESSKFEVIIQIALVDDTLVTIPFMESKLLDWATKHATKSQYGQPEEERQPVTKFDPELVEMILGKDQAVIMRELHSRIGRKRTCPEDERLALQELQFMLEDLDNAQNMHRMSLWPGIFEAFDLGENSVLVLGLLSTAAQNNPQVQNDLLSCSIFELVLLKSLKSENGEVAVKAVSATSAMIRNERPIYDHFMSIGGLECLESARSKHRDLLEERIDYLLNYLQSFYSQ